MEKKRLKRPSEPLYSCGRCKARKPRGEFYGKAKRDGWCKDCAKIRAKNYYAANKERAKEAHRAWVAVNRDRVALHRASSKYGLTEAEYKVLASHGACMICDEPLATPNIDHDHTTGEVRGVLCRSCNLGLGYFRDDAEKLARAIAYLEGTTDE